MIEKNVFENATKPLEPDYDDDNFTDYEVLQPGSEWNEAGNEDDFYPFGEGEESYASVDTWDTNFDDGSAVTDAELIAIGIHPHDYTYNKLCWIRKSFRKFTVPVVQLAQKNCG